MRRGQENGVKNEAEARSWDHEIPGGEVRAGSRDGTMVVRGRAEWD